MANKRKQGEGTVRLRKDGRWEGRVVVGYADNGNPRTKSVLAKTKTECLEKLEELKEQCGRTSDRLKPEMTFGDCRLFTVLQYLSDTRRHSDNSSTRVRFGFSDI